MLYANTVRYLRPVQIYRRLWKHIYRSRPGNRPAPPRRTLDGNWTAPIRKREIVNGPCRVRLLNEDGEIRNGGDWNCANKTRLWLYNLHYFDDLSSPATPCRNSWQVDLIDHWVNQNPPGNGVGWEPYPLSLRIVNWIKWDFECGGLRPSWTDSLATQLRWLEGRIEWHLLGNHLLANAKALLFGGVYFCDGEAERWRSKAFDIFERQLDEQVLHDGGHFERSPMYHAIVLEDLLDVLNVLKFSGIEIRSLEDRIEGIVPSMLRWLEAMTHPDGQIAFFNDATLGVAPTVASLNSYAEKLGIGLPEPKQKNINLLLPSGYFRMRRGGCTLIGDIAPVGPDYLPGHAHADTLSCEISVGAERVIVNGGTSVYGTGAQRQRERSTPAHSTVTIDGANSSQVWKGFRVAGRAEVRDIKVANKSNSSRVSACHDGYYRLPGKPVHRRKWELYETHLSISDKINCEDDRAIARFHLSPDVTATIDPEGKSGKITLASGRVIDWRASCQAGLEPSEFHPEFGITQTTTALTIATKNGFLETKFDW